MGCFLVGLGVHFFLGVLGEISWEEEGCLVNSEHILWEIAEAC